MHLIAISFIYFNLIFFVETSVEHEANATKGYEVMNTVKESTIGATAKPMNMPVTTTAYNTQASKYYKGRPIQSQPRTTRDGSLNNSYNR